MSDIWFQSFSDFLKISNAAKFIPRQNMNMIDKLNSIVRLSIYVSIIHYAFFADNSIFGIVLLAMVCTYVYYKHVEENYLPNGEDFSNAKSGVEKVGSERLRSDCTKPKDNNPFMNVLMNEYTEDPMRKEACDVDDELVKSSMDEKYFKDIYRDIDDAFDRKSSFRNFYTMPSTSIPNDQMEFAKWLYGSKEQTQKEGNGNRNKFFASYY